MDNKKFETLIDLIINENEEQARALFHDIVVEKSREIYEGMMDDEMDEGGMGGDEPASKDDIMNLEDKLDQLMAEFEDLMAGRPPPPPVPRPRPPSSWLPRKY